MPFDAESIRRRLADQLRAFTPAQLVIIGLLSVLTLVAALAVVRWMSAPSWTVLYAGLSPESTAEVAAELDARGTPYRITADGTAIEVPRSEADEARVALAAEGVPSGGVVGYELLDSQGLTTSEFRQRIDYQRAVEGELTRTLLAMDGVRQASVHLALPEDRLFERDQQPARASVLVDVAPSFSTQQVAAIVNLVASAVPGLIPENVTVADTTGRVLSAPDGAAGSAVSDTRLRLTRELERQLAADAETMLGRVFGPGAAVVRVSAQVNFDETTVETEDYGDTPVALREQTTAETFTGTGPVPAGVIGVDGSVVGADGGTSDYQRDEATREFGVDRTVTRSRTAPGQLERLSVAVVVDGTVEPAPDPDRVRDLVAAAVGLDPDRGDTIVVDTIAFGGPRAELAADEPATAGGGLGDVLEIARTAAGILILLIVALVLRRGMRTRVQPLELDGTEVSRALGAGSPDGEEPAPADSTAEDRELVAVGAAGELPAGSDDLMRVIDTQPDEVAVLLRSWLSDRS